MGIEGLLPFLKPIITPTHISAFEGKTIGIDAMSWLYRGCYSSFSEKSGSNIQPKDYLSFIQKSILMLKRHKIKPMLVFDGKRLLAKEKTEENRKKLKKENTDKAKECLEKGDLQEAKKFFSRAIYITKEMIYYTIELLKFMKIDFLVAPYEADAQLAYLQQNKFIDLAITEDSDLIAYGCQRILFKLSLAGEGQFLDIGFYCSENAKLIRTSLKEKPLKTFLSFPHEKVIAACVLAGCDYLPSIKGIGIKKAIDFLDRCGKLESVVLRLRFEKTFMGRIPDTYAKTAKKVCLVFKHQTVYDPLKRELCNLKDIPNDFNIPEQELKLIGEKFDNYERFVRGELDIKTMGERKEIKEDFKEMFKSQQIERGYIKELKIAIPKEVENRDIINTDKESNLKIFNDYEADEEDWEIEIYKENEETKEIIREAEIKPIEMKPKIKQKIDEEVDFLFEICNELAGDDSTSTPKKHDIILEKKKHLNPFLIEKGKDSVLDSMDKVNKFIKEDIIEEKKNKTSVQKENLIRNGKESLTKSVKIKNNQQINILNFFPKTEKKNNK